MMKYCSILHNMLLIYDGFEERYYTESFWFNIDTEDDSNYEDEVYSPIDEFNDTISLTNTYMSD